MVDSDNPAASAKTKGATPENHANRMTYVFLVVGLHDGSSVAFFLAFESEDLLEPYVLSTLRDSSRSMATVTWDVDADDSAIDGAALGVGDGGAS